MCNFSGKFSFQASESIFMGVRISMNVQIERMPTGSRSFASSSRWMNKTRWFNFTKKLFKIIVVLTAFVVYMRRWKAPFLIKWHHNSACVFFFFSLSSSGNKKTWFKRNNYTLDCRLSEGRAVFFFNSLLLHSFEFLKLSRYFNVQVIWNMVVISHY